VRKSGQQSVLRRVDGLNAGDTIEAQLAEGTIDATVIGTRKTNKD
jgi:exonuclease VII large subunit